MVVVVMVMSAAARRTAALPRRPLPHLRDPRVDEHVLRGQPLLRVLPQEAADEAARPRRDRVREAELAAPDLGEQALVLLPVKRIPITSEREGRL